MTFAFLMQILVFLWVSQAVTHSPRKNGAQKCSKIFYFSKVFCPPLFFKVVKNLFFTNQCTSIHSVEHSTNLSHLKRFKIHQKFFFGVKLAFFLYTRYFLYTKIVYKFSQKSCNSENLEEWSSQYCILSKYFDHSVL